MHINSEIYSILVSSSEGFCNEIISKLDEKSNKIHIVQDVADLNDTRIKIPGQLACILIDIDIQMENDTDLEKLLSRNKSNEELKYVPVVGLIKENCQNQVPSRNLFFHLLEAPFRIDALKHTIDSAHTDFKRFSALLSEVKSRNSAFGLINSGKFRLQTMEQAEALTTMLSLACPNPGVIALGLSELLVNAIEHGNLNISYEEKTELMEGGIWEEEVNKRLSEDTYKERFVEISFNRDETEINFTVKDQGNGFDWRPFMTDQIAATNNKHGRGIALALAMGFDHLSYNDKGNEVSAGIQLQKAS